MQLYNLFGRPYRGACVHLFEVLYYLPEQEGTHLEVKARKVA